MLFALRQEFIPCAAPLNVHLLFSISTDVLQDEPSLSCVNVALPSALIEHILGIPEEIRSPINLFQRNDNLSIVLMSGFSNVQSQFLIALPEFSILPSVYHRRIQVCPTN